ncbi:hypothetical protein VCRA2126O85_40164 [Vibrio crassostreae]|nr:hypothetical protein VCRA2128O100_40094 [Vibrio crassostreae]CAK2992343.1 hypothetical protein VCRA2125O83_40094 [Vibrio crassostreae]CAK2993907.1 hypothetical protein VCRA2127O91_40096 [Vibrio crassostreae]CAK2997417.1 hypothetical protein VCRA2128O106_40164 [Vibrio crassostreae]CAK2999851.1 hypothetical protein VCRA2126O86_40164 [Vibrio crassostreae]
MVLIDFSDITRNVKLPITSDIGSTKVGFHFSTQHFLTIGLF